MKVENRRKIFLGIFILTGAALFIAGIFMVGLKQDLFKRTFTVSSVFYDVKGLRPGDNVRYLGVRVGLVDEVTIISDTAIQVQMKLQKNAQTFIRKNALVSIGTDGLVGSKLVLISPGDSAAAFVEHQDMLASADLFNMDEMVDALDETLINLKHGTYNFNENMKALQHNFLLRKYFKKKQKGKKDD